MALKLYGILVAIILIIEYIIIQIPENIITDASKKIFDLIYGQTIENCERLEDNRDQCLQAANNTKFAIEVLIPLSTAVGIVGLIAAVKKALFDRSYT